MMPRYTIREDVDGLSIDIPSHASVLVDVLLVGAPIALVARLAVAPWQALLAGRPGDLSTLDLVIVPLSVVVVLLVLALWWRSARNRCHLAIGKDTLQVSRGAWPWRKIERIELARIQRIYAAEAEHQISGQSASLMVELEDESQPRELLVDPWHEHSLPWTDYLAEGLDKARLERTFGAQGDALVEVT